MPPACTLAPTGSSSPPTSAASAAACAGTRSLWFLRTYFGRRAVAKQTPAASSRTAPRRRPTRSSSACPSSLTPTKSTASSTRVRPPRSSSFDYLDRHELAWTPEQEPRSASAPTAISSRGSSPRGTYDLRMGMLPLRTHRQLFLSIAWDRLSRNASADRRAAAVRRRLPRPRQHDRGRRRRRRRSSDSTSASTGSASCAQRARSQVRRRPHRVGQRRTSAQRVARARLRRLVLPRATM